MLIPKFLVFLSLAGTSLFGAEQLLDLSQAAFAGAQQASDGVSFRFDMGRKRVNWSHARWSQIPLPALRDLSVYSGIRLTIATNQLRSDAGVALALQEADGSWYYQSWAADLTRPSITRLVRFDDLRLAEWVAPDGAKGHLDENQAFDPQAIRAVAIGCINPLGVGEVSFRVQGLELVPASATSEAPVPIQVTGRTLAINGTTMIPAGLFGDFPDACKPDLRAGAHLQFGSYAEPRNDGSFSTPQPHWTAPAVAVLIGCVGGDRYMASSRLYDPNWQNNYRQEGLITGRRLREYRKQYDRLIVLEWRNEPYLWSNRSRCNFQRKFFDVTKASELGPVHLTVDGSIAPFLRWTRNPDQPPWQWLSRENWRCGLDAEGKPVQNAQAPPAHIRDGETYTALILDEQGRNDPKNAKKRQLVANTPWQVYDETQFTYWSGQGQLRPYIDPMLTFGRGLKQTDPDAKMIVGWGFRPGEDHWAGFHLLYKPTIDASIGLIHGVNDHDYGGDVTRMPAQYEVVTAYGRAFHNTFLYNYNTECGENSDPAANPEASVALHQAGKLWVKTLWCSRKILSALATVSDKARSFTFHWFHDGAEGQVFRSLRNLRGKLVEVICPDPALYVVASIDGTDPLLPRPDYVGPGKELVSAVLNDDRRTRSIDLTLTAPSGTTFTGATMRFLTTDLTGGTVKLETTTATASGTTHRWQGQIPAKTFISLSLTLTGQEPAQPQVIRTQYVASGVLQRVTNLPDSQGVIQPVTLRLAIPEEDLSGSKQAWLRCVFENLAEGEGVLMFNEHRIVLPACATSDNVSWIRDIPIETAWLKTNNTLQFSLSDNSHAGYLVAMASIFTQR